MNDPQYNVVQFFKNGGSEYVHRYVDARTAVAKAHGLTLTVGARLGTTTRIIITDMDDCTCFEWTFGQGVTFV